MNKSMKQLLRPRRTTLATARFEGQPVPIALNMRKDIQKGYKKMAHTAFRISDSTFFSSMMIFWILVAAIIVGVETYPELSELQLLLALNWVVTVFFTLEVGLQVIAKGSKPWLFFIGPERAWNIFNFVIVVACYWNFHIDVKHMRVLRIIRIFRVASGAKLFKHIPQLRVITMGLVGCMTKVVYTVLFLTMTYYIYAVIGISAFEESDPFHFGTLHRAIITMFKLSTMENWYGVLYIDLWGCDKWTGGIYVAPDTPGVNQVFQCRHPKSFVSAAIFFVSFILVAAMVLMSLVVGGIILEMEKTIVLMKEEAIEAQRQFVIKQKMKKAEKIAAMDTTEHPLGKKIHPHDIIHAVKGDLLKAKNGIAHALQEESPRLQSRKTFISKKERQMILLRTLMLRAWAGMDVTKLQEEHFYFDHPYLLVRIYARFSLRCSKIVESKLFGDFILVIICTAGIVIGIETSDTLTHFQLKALSAIDFMFALVFTVEAAGKIIAEEFEPWRYFFNSWNIFDFVVVIGSMLSLFTMKSSHIFMLLRLLRIVRVLKIIKQLPFLQIIVIALLKSSRSILSLGLIIFVFDYTFAVIGQNLFGINDPRKFGSLHISMMTLFQISTRDGWSKSMFINAYGCDQMGYDEWPWMCQHPEPHYLGSLLFHIAFVGVCALVLLALFIGVVTTTMQQEGDFLNETKRVNRRILRVQTKYQLTNDCVKMYRDVFDFLDMDGGGTIGAEELDSGLKAIGKNLAAEELESLFSKVDVDGSGQIDVSEMIEGFAIMRFQGKEQERVLSSQTPAKTQKVNQQKEKSGMEVKKLGIGQKLRRFSGAVGKRMSVEGSEDWKRLRETLKHAPRLPHGATIHCSGSKKNSEVFKSPRIHSSHKRVSVYNFNPDGTDHFPRKDNFPKKAHLQAPPQLVQISSHLILLNTQGDNEPTNQSSAASCKATS